ncbi:MAG: hypothetical protein ACTHNU_13110 [Gaiellales bacterium]
MEDPESKLLVETLVAESVGKFESDGSVSSIVRRLLHSPVSDADRAGERLLVFGWQRAARARGVCWTYRVVGQRSGREYLRFALSLRHGPDVLMSMFGLQLQIALNGVDRASPQELACFLELMELSPPHRPRA